MTFPGLENETEIPWLLQVSHDGGNPAELC